MMDIGDLTAYLVSYATPVEGDVHKLVKACPNTLLEKSKRAFDLKGDFALEEFNQQYNLYVRVDDAHDIQGQGRFRLVRRAWAPSGPGSAGDAASPLIQPSFSTASTVSAAYILPSVGAPSPIIVAEEAEEFLSSTSVANTSSARGVDDAVEVLSVVEGSTSAGLLAPTSVASSARSFGDVVGASRGWFEPKHLSRRVTDLLTEKVKLSPKDWTEVMNLIYACYTQEEKSDEPSRSDYTKIAGAILTAYPHLRGQLSLDDAMKWVKRMIRDKFKNKRRTRPKSNCCDKSDAGRATGKRPSDSTSGSDKKRRKVEGLPNYAPEVTKTVFDIEVDKNQLRHVGQGDELDALMDETFPARRRAIVNEHVAVADLMEDYAPLFTEEQFWKELERMSGRKEFKKWAFAALEEWKQRIAATLKGSPDTALKQVTTIMKEKWLYETEEPRDGSPHLQRNPDGTFTIWVEQARCFVFPDADHAVVGFVLCHSLLNCAFTKRYKGVGGLVQRYVLGINDGLPVPDKTLGFVQRIGQ